MNPPIPAPFTTIGVPRALPWAVLVTCTAAAWLATQHLVATIALTMAAYVVFMAGYAWWREGPRQAADRVFTALVTGTFVMAIVPLVSVMQTVVMAGYTRLDWAFVTQTMAGVFGAVPGGALHAIVGTLLITLVTSLISVPIGILAAIFLTEYANATPLTRKMASVLRFVVDVMTGIPSIVAGLFAYAVFSMDVLYGVGARAGVIGAFALVILMIPIVVRNSEEMLLLVSRDVREASYALGVPQWRTIVRVVLPTAMGGLTTGVTLAIARVIGETAPLLVTVGNNVNLNLNVLHDRMATLPLFTFTNYMQPGIPIEAGLDRAWSGALVLMIIVMAMNLTARLITHYATPSR